MPGWMIDIFAKEQLHSVFIALMVMTLPFWLIILLFPRSGVAKLIANPLGIPSILAIGQLYLLYLLFRYGIPDINKMQLNSFQSVMSHPLVALLLLAQLQIMNLMTGLVVFRASNFHGFRPVFELITAYLLGPVAGIPYFLHLGLVKLRKS